jgi:hypothetical protein
MSVLQSISDNVLGLFYEEVQVLRCLTFPESRGVTVPDPTSGSSDRHIRFDAPGVLDRSVAVVCFQSTSDAPGASFSVRLNSTPHLIEGSIESRDPHSWQKLAVSGALMREHNELVFAVNEGSVTFSDVFILYTSNQLTVKKRRTIVATQ